MSKIRIFWAPSEERYALSCPPGGADFSNDMRISCGELKWKPKEKLWLFDEDSLREVIDICRVHWPNVKPDIEYRPKAQQATAAEVSAGNAAALNMFKVVGFACSKKIYHDMMLEYHPDMGKHPDHRKAAELTASWRAVKDALGW